VSARSLLEEPPVAHAASISDPVPFYGEHQAGIVTPAQDRLHFVSFDVITDKREDLVELLQEWTAAAARLVQGKEAGTFGTLGGVPEAAPDDTGEALGLPASGLTLTIGFGPSLFDKRFGLADKRPAALADLPKFPGEALIPEISGGDICVQACAHDPQVAVHAIRNLARIGFGKVSVRWSQLGFGRTSSTSRAQATPRNLMGFKDGTNNLKLEDAELLRRQLWVDAQDGPAWMTGGSYMVTRKIRMMVETWDRTSLGEQEAIFGRDKGAGAPLGKKAEFDPLDFAAKGADGGPLIKDNATCCAGATTSWTAPTGSAASTPGCSSSPTSGIRASSSCRCRCGWPRATPSTSTSSTSPAGCGRARRGCGTRVTTGGARSSPDGGARCLGARSSPGWGARFA
jgi:deferrochelatase/peroxidase EfeB